MALTHREGAIHLFSNRVETLIPGQTPNFWRLWKGLFLTGLDLLQGSICSLLCLAAHSLSLGRRKAAPGAFCGARRVRSASSVVVNCCFSSGVICAVAALGR